MVLSRLARRTLPLLSLVMAVPLVGCGRNPGMGILFAFRIVELAATIAATAPASPAPPEPIFVAPPAPPPAEGMAPSASVPPSQTTRVPVGAGRASDDVRVNDARGGFDPVRARGKLREVDVSACRARGLPRGYGHARITYALGGTVTEILIDEPAGLTPVAVACLAERYRDASVPPFQGTTRIEVGTTWYAP